MMAVNIVRPGVMSLVFARYIARSCVASEGAMASRTLFYRCAAGQEAQSVDSWYLIQSEDRSYWVEHAWSHCEKADNPDVGTETFSVAQVLLTVDDMSVLASFRAVFAGEVSKQSIRL